MTKQETKQLVTLFTQAISILNGKPTKKGRKRLIAAEIAGDIRTVYFGDSHSRCGHTKRNSQARLARQHGVSVPTIRAIIHETGAYKKK